MRNKPGSPQQKCYSTNVCLIIGAMKSGTTNLYNLLLAHPAICGCMVKEPEYFSPYGKRDWSGKAYLDLFPNLDPTQHKWVLEASTGYSKALAKSTPQQIHDYGLRPKIIYILRDPFERIESHYNFMRRHLNEEWQGTMTDDHVIIASDYIRHIKAWTRVFGSKSILLIDFLELKEKPNETLQKVWNFLRLQQLSIDVSKYEKNKTPHTVSFAEAWLYRRALPVGRFLPHPVARFGSQVFKRCFPKWGKMSRMSHAERVYVHEKLCENMQELKREWNFDVGQWGF